jgi:hypothetical protein
MTIASKENHDVYSEGESKVREKRSVTIDGILVLHPAKRLTGTADYSEMGTPPLYAVQEFITALAAANDGKYTPSSENNAGETRTEVLADGRIIFTHRSSHEQGTPEIQIKYQSLNPAPQFRAVVDAARSVVLAGGTMSPVGTHVTIPAPVRLLTNLAIDVRLY